MPPSSGYVILNIFNLKPKYHKTPTKTKTNAVDDLPMIVALLATEIMLLHSLHRKLSPASVDCSVCVCCLFFFSLSVNDKCFCNAHVCAGWGIGARVKVERKKKWTLNGKKTCFLPFISVSRSCVFKIWAANISLITLWNAAAAAAALDTGYATMLHDNVV